MSERIPVGVLGATGMVGQEFVSFLRDHPWFDLTWLGASDRSAGKSYREATTWRLGGATPAHVRDLVVSECKPAAGVPRLLFSAMDASVADRNRAGIRPRRPRHRFEFPQPSHG